MDQWPFFQLFFLGNIGQEKAFYNIQEKKTPFYPIKKQKVQKVEKLTFFQRR